MRMADIAVYFDQRAAERRWAYGINTFSLYIAELLQEEGVPWRLLQTTEELRELRADVLIVALEDETEATAELLRQFAEQGGTIISYAGLPRLASGLHCTRAGAHTVGYAEWTTDKGENWTLRGLNLTPWELSSRGAEAEGAAGRLGTIRAEGERGDSSSGWSALLQLRLGQGRIDRWALDIPATIVHLRQGTEPVLKDGIPAPDGTAKLDEGILKADDASALDWERDRIRTESGQLIFPHPYADQWREVCLRHIAKAASEQGAVVPYLGAWPEGVERVAMISFDSDGNRDEYASSTLRILEEHGVPSTWCMLEPGYSRDVYDLVREGGHELALHFNARVEEGCAWEAEQFRRQHEWFRQATGEQAVSNKNHYTRFEGWGELFDWCEANGIASDQTRGSSKPGNVGFLFGTCRPYFPVAWSNQRNRIYDVVEIGFLTQDMDLPNWADSSIIPLLLEQTARVDGVAHFLFHQIHIHKSEPVRRSFASLITQARERGYVFWTGRQVNDWVRAKRKVRIVGLTSSGQAVVEGEVPAGLQVFQFDAGTEKAGRRMEVVAGETETAG